MDLPFPMSAVLLDDEGRAKGEVEGTVAGSAKGLCREVDLPLASFLVRLNPDPPSTSIGFARATELVPVVALALILLLVLSRSLILVVRRGGGAHPSNSEPGIWPFGTPAPFV